jgi:hypothetical protein
MNILDERVEETKTFYNIERRKYVIVVDLWLLENGQHNMN